MSNRQWPYIVITAPADDNRDTEKQVQHEVKSTNALRAANKAKKAQADEDGVQPKDIQVLDAYRNIG